jgi:hypothetical protein
MIFLKNLTARDRKMVEFLKLVKIYEVFLWKRREMGGGNDLMTGLLAVFESCGGFRLGNPAGRG